MLCEILFGTLAKNIGSGGCEKTAPSKADKSVKELHSLSWQNMQLLQLYAELSIFAGKSPTHTHTVGSAADFCNTVRNSVKSPRAEDFKGTDPVMKVCKIIK